MPAEVTVECESEEGIADALSDAYGWLVSEIAVVEEIEVGHGSESGQANHQPLPGYSGRWGTPVLLAIWRQDGSRQTLMPIVVEALDWGVPSKHQSR
ncbi:hypothetical protein VDG04_00225 [Xanthomonas campestris pv. raphani]|nr:hypothetical protein [Xanthomonas campestris]MEA9895045.1 hypothetical protein [Xanthomonas campestris pv. raphani]